MSYFSKFPYIIDYTVQGRVQNAVDITRRTDITRNIKDNRNAYIEYTLNDHETPEMLADRIYDDSGLYWVILLFNDIFDVHSQWPLSYTSLLAHVKRKYGEALNDVHHYISAATEAVVDETHPNYDRIPITNYEHEVNINDSKKAIKIPDPDIVPRIVRIHNEKIRR